MFIVCTIVLNVCSLFVQLFLLSFSHTRSHRRRVIIKRIYFDVVGTLTGTTTSGHYELGSHNNEKIPISFRIIFLFLFSRYDSKMNPAVKLQLQRSEVCGVSLHCHYSQVHFDPDCLLLLRSHLLFWIHLFKKYYPTPSEMLADDLSLKSEWQQVSSDIQDSSQCSGRSQECCTFDGPDWSSDFHFFQSHPFQAFADRSKDAN